MNIQPKTIDPGWAKRWTRQSIELFRRAPFLAVGVMTLFVLVNAFVPQPLLLDAPSTVFLVGILFSSLRAADLDSGNAFRTTWMFFRQTVRDLALLSRDAFLAMLIFSIALGLFFYFYGIATHGAGAADIVPAYFHLPGWMREGVRQEGTMLQLGIFMPAAIPTIFLTMSLGNQMLLHYMTGYKAVAMNPNLLYTVFIGGIAGCSLLDPILRELPLPSSELLLVGFVLMAGFAAAFWWFGAWGYLWCREMFDGTKENAKATAKQRSRVYAAA